MKKINKTDELDIIKQYTQEQNSAYKIAEKYNVHPTTIYNVLKSHGVVIRSNVLNSAMKVNHEYFSKIDSCEKAYWLGYLYADGCISRGFVSLAAAIKDIDHIKTFKEHVEASHKIGIYNGNGYGLGKKYCRIIFKSTRMVNDLKSHGCVENKSLILLPPNNVPKIFTKDFIRGYFDGDGSITISNNDCINFKICGTQEVLLYIIQNLNLNLDYEYNAKLYKRKDDGKNNFYISFGGRNKVFAFLDWIYKDSSVFLKRKYDKYVLLKSVSTTGNGG